MVRAVPILADTVEADQLVTDLSEHVPEGVTQGGLRSYVTNVRLFALTYLVMPFFLFELLNMLSVKI